MARDRRFTETLADIRNGDSVSELTDHLRDLVTRVLETGRTGQLTLTLKVKSASKGGGNALVIEDDIKVKLPVHEKGNTFLFATEDGQLQRHDPRQPRLVPLEEGPTVTQMPTSEARHA